MTTTYDKDQPYGRLKVCFQYFCHFSLSPK
jgi:hypothetical protein